MCVVVQGNCASSPDHLLSIPICIWSYYYENMSFFFFIIVVICARVHVLLVVMVSEVCVVKKSERTCWTARATPASEPTL